jgi:hypothetical protein
MKPIKISLRIWIAITSLASFLAGWIVFSHAGKPIPLFSTNNNSTQTNVSTTIDPIPTLPPVPSLNSLVNNGGNSSGTITSQNNAIQPLPSLPNNNTTVRSFPRFRSGGS